MFGLDESRFKWRVGLIALLLHGDPASSFFHVPELVSGLYLFVTYRTSSLNLAPRNFSEETSEQSWHWSHFVTSMNRERHDVIVAVSFIQIELYLRGTV